MTKASAARIKSKKAREIQSVRRANVATTAAQVAAHGRMIEVEIDGAKVVMWCMPASAHQVVMAALQTLARG